ncbi:hypothetical protein KJ828_02725, partial [Patescibacteria group bacterium]|nr:hypothetical protein [Patescibacteria group bacterium]
DHSKRNGNAVFQSQLVITIPGDKPGQEGHYFEVLDDIRNAILREKQIKAGSRKKKEDLINNMNRAWKDLSREL